MIRIYLRIVTFFLIFSLFSCSNTGLKRISILETTDIHGVILPYDFIEKEKLNASMASSFTYLKYLREKDVTTVLLDNGDNLQGQPAVYYYNFIDTVSPHFLSEVMNFMGYDACTVGNHDIEAGHDVYDRLVKLYNFPLLAANAIEVRTGKPYFEPYHIINKGGVKIAVLGLVTPAIPNWLPQELYSGMEFRDMAEAAKEWMPEILSKNPDIVVGLFHSGWERSKDDFMKDDPLNENGSAAVAYKVPGFDIIFNGHDHRLANEKFVNSIGDTVLILNGGSRSEYIAQADIIIDPRAKDSQRKLSLSGKLVKVSDFIPDPEFIEKFESQNKSIDSYVNQVIGHSSATISSRDAYFGSSSFVDMIHTIQLEISGADISFAAPLSFDVQIPEGTITVGDMFKLYRFENMLYTMEISGEEVKNYLEYSYAGWFNTMNNEDDIMLSLQSGKNGKPVISGGKVRLNNPPYDFDSAAGINYTVDVSKPEGSRITIHGFSDGRLFEQNRFYKVAVNSYRGNGGGGHFTVGANIDKGELKSRVITSTDKDLRFFIMKYIESKKIINPMPLNNWKIIPENWAKTSAKREYLLLFGSENN